MTTGASARLRFWVAVAILCAPPFVLGIQGTRNLDWPDDPDLFREGAQAQSFADGQMLNDPYYLGEWIWYPPLVPGLVAGLSRITGTPVPTVYAQAGAYLNMLGPILLAALVARCFGSLASLVALAVFLYQVPRGPTGAAPFYSTLLYSGNFAQALFYLTLLAYVSLAEERRARYVLTGALLGLTFLGHAAPFVVLAVLFFVEFTRAAWRDPRARPGAIRPSLRDGGALRDAAADLHRRALPPGGPQPGADEVGRLVGQLDGHQATGGSSYPCRVRGARRALGARPTRGCLARERVGGRRPRSRRPVVRGGGVRMAAPSCRGTTSCST